MSDVPGLLIGQGDEPAYLLPRMSNRHGLIAGATGTGKTFTLKVMAERFSDIGVPVFMADIKGDLSGTSLPGAPSDKLTERLKQTGLPTPHFAGYPVEYWDLFGESGLPIRTMVSEMGPLLLARILELNDTQEGVLNIAFRVADDQGLLLLDLKDLRSMLAYLSEHAKEVAGTYGNVSTATVGAIQRGLLQLEQSGADQFFGEPALDLHDFMRVDPSTGRGVINILEADRLMRSPLLYATFLLWMLSELFEQLPEVGDPDQPNLVFFFDEAHLLFDNAPSALLSKIEQVVRLIRSKGVGVFFITQNPIDIPDTVLGQLGNRVQHALRAFTPKEQKAIDQAAETYRTNPKLNVARAVQELQVGEALVSFLQADGTPAVVERAFIAAPASQFGPATPQQVQQAVNASRLHSRYAQTVDRDSAYEMLQRKAAEPAPAAPTAKAEPAARAKPNEFQKMAGAFAGSMMHAIGAQIGREIMRGVLGGLTGSSRTRRR
jgi:DNA helicase HerA-like ATPase